MLDGIPSKQLMGEFKVFDKVSVIFLSSDQIKISIECDLSVLRYSSDLSCSPQNT